MKQYCRHCCYLNTENGIWCRKLEQGMSRAVAESVNRCHDYVFTPLDALGGEETPRVVVARKKQCDGQMSLF